MKNIFSIVMPVRVDSEERVENIKSVLAWTDRMNSTILLLEADKNRKLESVGQEFRNVRYIFEEDHSELFHRTMYINKLLHYANTEVVAVWDADIIVAYRQIAQAISLIKEGACTIAYPYMGKLVMLSPELSDGFRKNPDIEYLCGMNLPASLNRPFCGGVYLVDRMKYLSVGGENERFVDWGPEDAERFRRVQILGQKVSWLPAGEVFHLYHSRDGKQQGFENPRLVAMRKEFIKECGMSRDEMAEYVKIMNKKKDYEKPIGNLS